MYRDPTYRLKDLPGKVDGQAAHERKSAALTVNPASFTSFCGRKTRTEGYVERQLEVMKSERVFEWICHQQSRCCHRFAKRLFAGSERKINGNPENDDQRLAASDPSAV
ncbi:MAG: hypothetical protein MUC83_10975 [Pirellula sp.]|nr:hypothetical protein [Pirellula sp.]